MFLGEYVHSLDSKGRLTIPAKFRDRLIPGLVVTRHPGGKCLMAMPMDEWERISDRVGALPFTNRSSALLRRALFGSAEDLKPDRQGRILISRRLRDFARLDQEILVAGINTYIELWEPERWNREVISALEDDNFDPELFAALEV